MNIEYISKGGLKNLDNYSYHGTDESFFGNNILNPYWWNFLIEYMPKSIAPNLITLIGFVANTICYLLFWYYSTDFITNSPVFVYFASGILIFFYQTMDNLDGKQARRTKSSSPLGELFDHVCDASSLLMLVSVILISLRGGKYYMVMSFTLTAIQFYLTHWEEYFTGVLLMGKWDGPTEGQIMIISVTVFQGVMILVGNEDFWLHKIVGGISGRDIFIWAYCINSVFSTRKVVLRSFAAMRSKNKDIYSSILVLAPFTSFTIMSVIWFFTIVDFLTDMQLRLYFNCVCLLFGYLTSRLIVQRICQERCVIFYPILVPMAIVVLNNLLYPLGLNVFSQLTGVWLMFWLTLFQYFHFGHSIIQQLTKYLKINAFTIPPVRD
eukprot:TRINITY_DN1044_c2_g1_i1.p1 TRINITY_DN1044_c2_g1~~TRINITY_DN1044_c2_g1_i1.p1  ORF type:complete len:380 (-),score=58.86 TRINITY_DN1044_c2_g1_i1:73-1212(-)